MDIFLNKRDNTFYLLFLKAFIFYLCKFSFEEEYYRVTALALIPDEQHRTTYLL